ncbi:MAG: hypothetical protein WED04_09500 [Promethearchaeati archaeon SRVP18_Atabeyarchaeia-1]
MVKHGRTIRKVAFFCTKASSEASKVFGAMESLTRKAPAAILDLKKGEIGTKGYYRKLNVFLGKIRGSSYKQE